MKTTELIGPALDWAVAKAAGRMGQWIRDEARPLTGIVDIDFDESGRLAVYVPGRQRVPYAPWSPSTDWAQGGPIIERECLALECIGHCWEAYTMIEVADEDFLVPQSVSQTGPTPLIAAMRCYVASKLGDEVEVPEELL